MARKTLPEFSRKSNGRSVVRRSLQRRSHADVTSMTHQRGRITQKYGTVVRTNEFQAWFVFEHVVDTPLVMAE